MTHALATHPAKRDFNAALFADNTPVLHPLVLAAKALVILYGAKDTRAEQPVPLRLERPVVDGFRLFYLTKRPRHDPFGAGDRNLDLIEALNALDLTKKAHQLIH